MESTMRISQFDVYQVAIPFRISFHHAQASRRHSESIFVRCELEDGTVGFGEGLPREYVTGESWAGCFDDLAQRILPLLLDCEFNDHEEVETFCAGLYNFLTASLSGLPRRPGAACCAAELALLDAFGRHFGCSAFASRPEDDPVYSGVIPGVGPATTLAASLLYRCKRIPAVKLKVGTTHDLANARLARLVLGPEVSLRADANMAWSMEEALRMIPRLGEVGIHFVEQPIATGQLDALHRIQVETGAAIVADEDLCDLRDARNLAARDACRVFNIRLSKCGGFFQALHIGRIAREYGLEVQVGCQVGESALLAAAGLAAARRLAPVVFAEGCFGRRLLREDVMTAAEFEFGRGGTAPRYAPALGLGIDVDERVIARHARAQRRVAPLGRMVHRKG
jgi:muconate cycloisomerase